jgi:hypothetical protein
LAFASPPDPDFEITRISKFHGDLFWGTGNTLKMTTNKK